MLLHLDYDSFPFRTCNIQGIVYSGQTGSGLLFGSDIKMNVHYGTDNLDDVTDDFHGIM